jgi:hypothetical protein
MGRCPQRLDRLSAPSQGAEEHLRQLLVPVHTQACRSIPFGRIGRGLNLSVLLLALVATAVGLTGAPVLQCGGEAMTSVTTTLAQLGPQGTTAER